VSEEADNIEGLCGDPTCRARVIARLHWPADPLVSDPCDRCAAAATAFQARQREGL
jgi:hypothetical protein